MDAGRAYLRDHTRTLGVNKGINPVLTFPSLTLVVRETILCSPCLSSAPSSFLPEHIVAQSHELTEN